MAQVAERSCGCLIPGGIQGQVGWGPGQPDLRMVASLTTVGNEDTPEQGDLYGPFKQKTFYDSISNQV